MDLGLETYANLESPLHRWGVKQKLIGLTVLIFAFAFVQHLIVLPAMLLVTAVIFALSRLPLDFLMHRLRYPGIFVGALAVVLPLFSGSTVLISLGPLAIRQEGLLAFVLIFVKFICILTLSLVLFGTAPFLKTIKATRSLGLSPILADMMLLSYRYIYEVAADLTKMQTAMRLRGFRAHGFSRRTLNALAILAGSLLVRSYERSERVYKAMILRGYGRAKISYEEFQAQPYDLQVMALMIAVAAGFVMAELAARGL